MRNIYRIGKLLGEGSYGQVYSCVFIKENFRREEERRIELERKFNMRQLQKKAIK